MKLAIHCHEVNMPAWNKKWIELCEKKGIEYIGINCYDPDLISILKEKKITHLMWAFTHELQKDSVVARSIMTTVEKMGIKTFPDFNTSWHFEDKIAQKYLLESIDAPIVNSWVFFDFNVADNFLKEAQYPLVAKLRKGAGSYNVKLLKNYSQAISYSKKMLFKGVNPSPKLSKVGERKFKNIIEGNAKKINIKDLLKKAKIHLKNRKIFSKEVGYVYFQEFLPNNKSDLRIVVVGNRAWGFYRGIRKNDFRASGSGLLDYETPIPIEVIKSSFTIAQKLEAQSIAFDYVKATNGEYKIVEICYGYVGQAVYDTKGYWDENLEFHEGHYYPEECILNDFIKN